MNIYSKFLIASVVVLSCQGMDRKRKMTEEQVGVEEAATQAVREALTHSRDYNGASDEDKERYRRLFEQYHTLAEAAIQREAQGPGGQSKRVCLGSEQNR